MFVHLVLLPVPRRLGGEIAALEPAGKRPVVVVDYSVLSQFYGFEETSPTDIADVLLEILSAMHSNQVLLKTEK